MSWNSEGPYIAYGFSRERRAYCWAYRWTYYWAYYWAYNSIIYQLFTTVIILLIVRSFAGNLQVFTGHQMQKYYHESMIDDNKYSFLIKIIFHIINHRFMIIFLHLVACKNLQILQISCKTPNDILGNILTIFLDGP